MARDGDEIVIEENGEKIGRLRAIKSRRANSVRKFGRGRIEGYFMSDDFDDELPDSFWGFDEEP
jgi:antitoxin (DNA-binding transcriptional repressor) of toxin-antitoxin stability system